jgi:ABC-2 type transport system ATP-binding protein
MSPEQALTLTASYYASPRPVPELISELGLSQCARTPWRRLSGGERQRTLLALALVGRPDVLVLDEPSSAVDPEGHHLVRDLLTAERDAGRAILLATHELADVEAVADRVVIVRRGSVVAAGTLSELAGDPVIYFSVDGPLDVSELVRHLDAVIEEVTPGQFRCALAATPERISLITNFVGASGANLRALRTHASLEETYLELVRDETP